jgi:hypothetical protein
LPAPPLRVTLIAEKRRSLLRTLDKRMLGVVACWSRAPEGARGADAGWRVGQCENASEI